MNRRTTLKSLGVIAAGIALLPSCSDGLAFEISEGKTFALSAPQAVWMNALSQAILPYGDKEIESLENFPDFVTKMVSQTYASEKQTSFINGYNNITTSLKESINSSTKKILPGELIEFFKTTLASTEEETMLDEEKKQLEDSKEFINSLRGLSIYHLTTSQTYMESVDEYKIVPGTYQGAVTI